MRFPWVRMREIFCIVWVAIEIIYLFRELTVYKIRHPRHGAFWSDISSTTFIINVGSPQSHGRNLQSHG
jgi:hypothetical protein